MIFTDYRVIKKSRHFALLILALIPLALMNSGCMLGYLARSSLDQMSLLAKRKPLEKFIGDEKTDPEVKRKLKLAQEVRNFAENELGFKATQNYKTYVDIGRPYVTWIVMASPKNELKTYTWWFPIIGRLPYKGYFKKESAEKEAQKLDPAVYDTFVRGATAYSTLGWFNDPLLSSMLRGDDEDLVHLVLHESAHTTVFIKNHADFNEQLATFLGHIGTEKFYLKKEGPESSTLKQIELNNYDEKIFSQFIQEEIKNLKEWYQKNTKPNEDQRQQQFEDIRRRFTNEWLPRMKTKRYQRWPPQKLNNAILLSYSTYVYDLSDFYKLYEKLNKSTPSLIQFLKSLEKSKNPSQDLKNYLQKPDP